LDKIEIKTWTALIAIDVWSNACVFFVFSALMEFAFVNYAAREDRRRGYIGRDYGEDDDDIDYTKGMYNLGRQ